MARTKQSPAPSRLEDHLGFWLRLLSNHVSLRFQQQLEAESISVTEWVALRTLWDRNETSHSDLIQSLGMTKGATSKAVSRLEEKGLTQRQLAAGRLREQTLVLTAAGRALVPRLAQLADDNDDHFFSHLPAREKDLLIQTLQALVHRHKLKELPTA